VEAASTIGQDVVRLSADAGRSGRWVEDLAVASGRSTPLTLDLRDVSFTEPLFVLRLIAALDVQTASGRSVVVVPPADRGVANYMARIGVRRAVPVGCRFDLPNVLARDRSDVLVELRRIASVDQVDPLAEEFSALVRAQLKGPLQEAAHALVLALSELCENATTHGRNEHGAYVCAQRYQSRRCVLAIGDLGIGMPKHVRRTHPNILADGPAIAAAVQPGVSGTIEPDRGDGYAALIKVLLRACIPFARLRVWSGAGRLQLVFRPARRPEQSMRTVDSPILGTWVEIDIRDD
jgi:hypothetical protein